MKKYETVNTKHGKAIVADTQTELQNIAKQINGDVVLLIRRDGEDRYNDLGTVTLPYGFGITDFTPDSMNYGADAETYVIHDIADYRSAVKEENALIQETADSHLLIKTDGRIIKEIETFHDGDCMFLRFINGWQFYDTFRREQTHWHDADVWEYRLAVVIL